MERLNKKLKIFISYSHNDNHDPAYIEEFKKHLAPLKNNGLVEEWYDRMILPGEDYQSKINNNLEDADIVCLFISSNFLNSPNCRKEQEKALDLQRKKKIQVVPIILSPSGWLDDEELSKLLALPTDGKPVSKFHNRDEAWLDVYNGLKKIIDQEIKIRELQVTEEFKKFLRSTEMLTMAHPRKERVYLEDIFVFPELDKYDHFKDYTEIINAEELLKNILDYPKIVIAGESRSGKTTLAKVIFKELRKRNYIPVFISDSENRYSGKIENKIIESLRKQYNVKDLDLSEIDKERIIPILDDFHHAKNMEKHIKVLSSYPRCILTVDDIFSLNIKNGRILGEFSFFRIREFKPSLRYEIVKKWVSLKDMEIIDHYKEVDEKTELIDSILGKIIGKRIMPAYPFFILSAVITHETLQKPINQEITSQGYYYEALIVIYLTKQGVKSDEIDIYINFLTEIAFYIYKNQKYELSPTDFNSFLELYKEKYTLPIKQETLLKKIAPIIKRNSFNNYLFIYPYVYYFFTAKYLAEHIEENEIMKEIEKIMRNLDIEEYAYIAVFLTYHSKSSKILEEIEINAMFLFDKHKPATLYKEEVKFFDEQADIIVKAALPSDIIMPEQERAKRLSIKDKIEENKEKLEKEQQKDTEEDDFSKELRRAIRTGEVIGCIIKNRVGSLGKEKVVSLFKEGMEIYLRILSYFFAFIKNEQSQQILIDLISKILKESIAEKEKEGGKVDDETISKMARFIFWNLSFLIVNGIIGKIIYALGSDKLTEIVGIIDSRINTPVSFLVKHGILMWYNKNLQINELSKKIKEKGFSEIAQNILKFMVVDYLLLHPVTYKDRQRIESKLGIPVKKLPVNSKREKDH